MSISPISSVSHSPSSYLSSESSSVSGLKRKRLPSEEASSFSAADFKAINLASRTFAFGENPPSRPKKRKKEEEQEEQEVSRPLVLSDLEGCGSAGSEEVITPPKDLVFGAPAAIGGAGTGSIVSSASLKEELEEEPKFSLSRGKYERRTSKRTSRLEDPFKDLLEEIIERNQIVKDGRVFRIAPIQGAKGSYSQVYSIETEETPLVDGKSNKELVVKVILQAQLEKHGGRIAQSWLKNSLSQYNALLSESDLPIMSIYNAETAITDGYVIAEKITPLRKPLWNETTSIETLKKSEEMKSMLDLLRLFFNKALEETGPLALDLQIGNFGWNRAGDLVLADFKEEEANGYDGTEGSAFKEILRQCLESVALGNKFVEKFLLKGTFDGELDKELASFLQSDSEL